MIFMNKKGFTLVELLAIIILLAIMVLIATPAITKTIRDGRDDANKSNYDVVLNAAYDYVLKNNLTISKDEETVIKVQDLINAGFVKSDTKDAKGRLLAHDEVHVIKVEYSGPNDNQENDDKENDGKVKYFGSYKFTYYIND